MPQAQANVPTELEAAFDYASRHVPVFPCSTLDKKPLTPHGFKDATTDETQVRAWWTQWPNAMISIPTGSKSGIWALDTDKDPAKQIDGEAVLASLEARHSPLPKTRTSITARGGKHRLFLWDSNIDIRNSTGKIGLGIDVRGEGGYICAPPSQTANGGTYRWEDASVPPVPAPTWLITLAKAKRADAYSRAALERECKKVRPTAARLRSRACASFHPNRSWGWPPARPRSRSTSTRGWSKSIRRCSTCVSSSRASGAGASHTSPASSPRRRCARMVRCWSSRAYDSETELCLMPGFQIPPIPEHPSKDQANAALKLLVDLLSEFSFKQSGGGHEKQLNRSVALSGLLTALVRGSLPTAPTHLIRAHMAGTGKSYLVDVFAAIATGRLCPVITASKSSEETEKRLDAIIHSGIPMFSLDNCAHDLGGERLCQVSERPVVKIRILGYSETPDCDVHTAIYATGNNIGLKGDMVRRGLVCNLEALDERPELRRFNRSALKTAGANRATYVAAALTVMRAYLAAGAPEVCGPFGSYEDWSRMVRSPLLWLGEPDPVASVDTSQAEDPELAELRELLEWWLGNLKLDEDYLSARLVEIANEPPVGFNPSPLKDLFLRIAADKNAEVSTKRLGEWLRQHGGRVVRLSDGRRYWLIRGQDYRHTATFRLSEVT